MCKGLIISCALVLCMISLDAKPPALQPTERICGKWESEEKNLIVELYSSGNNLKAKVVWFKTGNGKPMEEWTDVNNPDVLLRQRKVLGMDVLQGLVYDAGSNSWENGIIYDSKHGRYWNASVRLDINGSLKVKGYWHLKFIGKTLTFYRV